MITTASTSVSADLRGNPLLKVVIALYALVWLWAAVEPVYPFDWLLENILTVMFVALLVAGYRRRPLSDLSYVLIVLFLGLHAVGGHYTYSEVPLGVWLKDALDLGRNHYDRIVHFSFGLLLAYPLREVGLRYGGASQVFASLAALGFVCAGSASFEVIEMLVAMIVDPQAGQAYLGTQGDEWDGQKDMALAMLGAVLAMSLIHRLSSRRSSVSRSGTAS